MKTYQSYASSTGEILRTLNIESYMKCFYEQDGEVLVEGDGDARTHYVDTKRLSPVVIERPLMQITQDKQTIVAGIEDFVKLSNLPRPCRVRVGVYDYDIFDGVAEWRSLMPGEYKIVVLAWPYHDWEGKVTVLANNP